MYLSLEVYARGVSKKIGNTAELLKNELAVVGHRNRVQCKTDRSLS